MRVYAHEEDMRTKGTYPRKCNIMVTGPASPVASTSSLLPTEPTTKIQHTYSVDLTKLSLILQYDDV